MNSDSFDDGKNTGLFHTIKNVWNTKLKSIKVFGIIVGICMLVLGIAGFIFPVEMLYVLELVFSAVIVATGIYQIVTYITSRGKFLFSGVLISGILNIIIGCILCFGPASVTIGTYSWLLAFVLISSGLHSFSLYSGVKQSGGSGAGWLIFNGIISLCLAAFCIFAPYVSAVSFAIILDAYMIVYGLIVLIEAIAAKPLK